MSNCYNGKQQQHIMYDPNVPEYLCGGGRTPTAVVGGDRSGFRELDIISCGGEAVELFSFTVL